MILHKKIDVFREDTECYQLMLNKYRDDEGLDGVQLIAWHKKDEYTLIQTDFIQLLEQHISSFIRDYSNSSAQSYVDQFNP